MSEADYLNRIKERQLASGGVWPGVDGTPTFSQWLEENRDIKFYTGPWTNSNNDDELPLLEPALWCLCCDSRKSMQ